MKTKLLLITISCTTLFFTSCEDEMDKGGTGGGGKENANTYTNMEHESGKSYPDSILYKPNEVYDLNIE